MLDRQTKMEEQEGRPKQKSSTLSSNSLPLRAFWPKDRGSFERVLGSSEPKSFLLPESLEARKNKEGEKEKMISVRDASHLFSRLDSKLTSHPVSSPVKDRIVVDRVVVYAEGSRDLRMKEEGERENTESVEGG